MLAVAGSCPGASAGDALLGYGRTPTAAEIAGWDIDARGQDGKGLPPGHGTVKQGEALFAEKCAACHGDFGEGDGRFPELIGGRGSLASNHPLRTVASYWPYAPTLFDYIRRAMPYNAPQSLNSDETYALVAYILAINDLLPSSTTLDAAGLAAVRMPNRDGFRAGDPRPDVHNEACMHDCRQKPVAVQSVAPKPADAPDRGR